ncbi:hypothetical protein Misp02_71270 [Microtetraspora sp. NBRC 16547]|nr:hypothetical protein Misp02_71270 [Microtetraspora sp. NBRC 16547]
MPAQPDSLAQDIEMSASEGVKDSSLPRSTMFSRLSPPAVLWQVNQYPCDPMDHFNNLCQMDLSLRRRREDRMVTTPHILTM